MSDQFEMEQVKKGRYNENSAYNKLQWDRAKRIGGLPNHRGRWLPQAKVELMDCYYERVPLLGVMQLTGRTQAGIYTEWWKLVARYPGVEYPVVRGTPARERMLFHDLDYYIIGLTCYRYLKVAESKKYTAQQHGANCPSYLGRLLRRSPESVADELDRLTRQWDGFISWGSLEDRDKDQERRSAEILLWRVAARMERCHKDMQRLDAIRSKLKMVRPKPKLGGFGLG